jgi:hypothetical protein
VESKKESIACAHWEIIADNLQQSRLELGCVSAIYSNGRTIWIADAHCDNGKRLVARADEMVTAFLELETSTIASPSQAPTASILAASSPSNSAIDQLWRGLGSFESSASESLGEMEPKSVEAPNPTLSEFAKYAVKLREQVMAHDPAPTEPTSPSPAPAATVSEVKPPPKDTTGDNSTLDSFLKQEGFGVVKLKQENLDNHKAHKNDPKHLIVDVEVNRVSASLMVDTGTPTTNIARGRLKKFGVVEQKTSLRVTSPLRSASNKFYGIAKLSMLAMGNCMKRIQTSTITTFRK